MILVIGGTSDSILICKELDKLDKKYMLSVATDYGKTVALSKNLKGIIECGRKDEEKMVDFIVKNDMKILIDSSHPYAGNVSKNAIAACEKTKVKYLRFERESFEYNNKKVINVWSYEEAIEKINDMEGNLFVSTGANNIELISNKINSMDRLIVRLLPQAKIISTLEKLGLNSGQIIGMKGPFNYASNKWMFEKTDSKILLTKESGREGMVDEKIKAAIDLEMTVILIGRPKVDYPISFDSIEALIDKELVDLK